MQQIRLRIPALASVFLLAVASAHGHNEDMPMVMGEPSISGPTLTMATTSKSDLPSYFNHGEHSGLMVAHIMLMTLGWVFVLPIGVMLSISRSRYSLPFQFIFLGMNGIGVLLATIYNASTPYLYPNNAHHKLGWILTWVVSAQALMGVVSAYMRRKELDQHEDQVAFIPISDENMAKHQRFNDRGFVEEYRYSNDSGQGTEPNTESLRSQSISSNGTDLPVSDDREFEEDEQYEKAQLVKKSPLDSILAKISGLLSSRVLRILRFFYTAIDRTILLLGWTALATGLITYGGIFAGDEVFSGLAHFIKGGVFFWYGILTLGRWAGCFAEIGWAWNISPSQKIRPSAEFVESFLIFFYGATNIFLEHLAAWGSEWTAQDLEHVSITVMFIGGGLCGMLVESTKIRSLLNTIPNQPLPDHTRDSEPKTYKLSMNPLPALVVLLVGLMMSSHHQESMVSTMMHSQWGNLLAGAAFARGATCVIFYLSPPDSTLPGRPPTELITSFCLMAGGLIFMASARDTVQTIEDNNLDAMFVFTVSTGLITFLMAWIILVIAIKGWAVRRENRVRYRNSGANA